MADEVRADEEQVEEPGEQGTPGPGEPPGSPGTPSTGPLRGQAASPPERDELLDTLQRVQAEFDNYRKRAGGGGRAPRRGRPPRPTPAGPPAPTSGW
jgi:molecular chaperone GrpE (heat shock protein)